MRWQKVRNGTYVLVDTDTGKELGNVHREVHASNYSVWQAMHYMRYGGPDTQTVQSLAQGKVWLEDRVKRARELASDKTFDYIRD